MQGVSKEQLTQELAVLRKILTRETASYDRTLDILESMPLNAVAPQDVSIRLLKLAMSAKRSVVDEFKRSVGAMRDEDVRFEGATVGYLLKVAKVLYAPSGVQA